MNKQLMYYFQGNKLTSTCTSRNLQYAESAGNNNESTDSQSSNNDNNKQVAVCNCNRSPETIMCKRCGHTFIGRLRKACEIHKNTFYLMDYAHCVWCKRQL